MPKTLISIINHAYEGWPEEIPDYQTTAKEVINQFGNVLALEHRQDSSRVVYVHPCMKEKNKKWQGSFQDSKGMFGDIIRETPLAVIEQCLEEGYWIVANEYH